MSAKAAVTLMACANRMAVTMSKNAMLIEKSVSTNLFIPHSNSFKHTVALRHDLRMLSPCRFYSSEKSAEQVQTDADTDSTEVMKKLTQEVETLTKELKTVKEKNDDLTDKYKRALADSENLRVRLTKQIADAKIFGIQSFCKDLLEVADTLGHATAAVPQDQCNDTNPHLKSLYEGLCMTKASLLQVFKRHGLEPVNPLNEKFDPNVHEALFQKDDPKAEPNTVVEVTKLGYKLHDRCIRPALVGVSK